MDELAPTAWRPGNDGTGRRLYFLWRPVGADGKQEWFSGASDRLVRFGSYATANRRAEQLNALRP